MKKLRIRAILVIVALAILLGVAVYVTYAWYTKITAVSATEFKIARWDFNANYQIDNFKVNVYEYQSVYGHNIAAPGTAGTLDIQLGAQESDTDITCVLQLDKGGMSPDFQDRIYFYRDKNMTQEMKMDEVFVTTQVSAHGQKVAPIYWRWIYDYDEYLEMHETKTYFACSRILRQVRDSRVGSAFSLDTLYMLSRFKNTYGITLTDLWNGGEPEATETNKLAVYLYLKSLSDAVRNVLLTYESALSTFRDAGILSELNTAVAEESWANLDAFLQQAVWTDRELTVPSFDYVAYFSQVSTDPVALGLDAYYDGYLTQYNAFDDFDTRVGANPEAFKQYMNAVVYVSGSQTEPVATDSITE